jgi:hypothetical protein
VIGALPGLAIGVTVDFGAGCDEDDPFPRGELFGCLWPRDILAVLLGLGGASTGAICGGYVAPGEKWEIVSHKSVRIGAMPVVGPPRKAGVLMQIRIGISTR